MLRSKSERFTATICPVRTAQGHTFSVAFRDTKPHDDPVEAIIGFSYNLPVDFTFNPKWTEQQVTEFCQKLLDDCDAIHDALYKFILPARDVLQACKQLNEDYGAMCITTPDVAQPVSVSKSLDKIANYYCG